MTYWQHLRANMKVAARALVLAGFHALHGILPLEITSHEHWGIHGGRNESEKA